MIESECFIVLKPHTKENAVVLGRNAYHNEDEASEILYFPQISEPETLTIQCGDIEVKTTPTVAVVLNKPAGVWGAEAGSNDKGVSISISWADEPTDHNDYLHATDLTRLALERCTSAVNGIEILASLADEYNQTPIDTISLKQCFVICDSNEVWLFNLIGGKLWAAEVINEGCKHIGTGLSISTKFDKTSEDFNSKIQELGLWDGNCELNLVEIFKSTNNNHRIDYKLSESDKDGEFAVSDMFAELRDSSNKYKKAHSSYVSTLSVTNLPCFWFTATPNPVESVFKPFVFTQNAQISPLTKIPTNGGGDGGDNVTLLHKLHGQRNWSLVGDLLKSLELTCVDEVKKYIVIQELPIQEFDELLKDCVEAEVKFYR